MAVGEEKVFISGARDRLYVRRDGVIEMATGAKVVPQSGVQASAIADPTGGATTDAEARAAIVSILAALRGAGIIAS